MPHVSLRLRPPILAIALGACLLPSAGRAQHVEYVWRTGELKNVGLLRSGSVVQVRITDINALCYDYEISIAQIAATETLPDIIGLFSGTDIPKAVGPAPTSGPEAAPGAGDPKNDADRRLRHIENSLSSVEVRLKSGSRHSSPWLALRAAHEDRSVQKRRRSIWQHRKSWILYSPRCPASSSPIR